MAIQPVRWGVLGVAKIADTKILPPITKSPLLKVEAIASRSLDKAQAAARTHGIARAYGSYEELIADKDIEAIYIPLPNHMHVDWTLKAAAAGKHVLCEKPIALTAAEVATLAEAAKRHGVRIMEGFMVFSHPLWQKAKAIIEAGRIGPVHALHMNFASPNYDPANIRNRAEVGGGSLTDKGCYGTAMAQYVFDGAPTRVIAAMDIDHAFNVDRLTTGLLEFPTGQASFNCASQLSAFQNLVVMGERGRLEIDIPVNAPDDVPTRLHLTTGSMPTELVTETIEFPLCNQYRLMFEQFSEALRNGGPLSVSLDFSANNARVIEALFRSKDSGKWESVG